MQDDTTGGNWVKGTELLLTTPSESTMVTKFKGLIKKIKTVLSNYIGGGIIGILS